MRAPGGIRRNRQRIATLTPVLATVALLAGCSNGSATPSTTRPPGSSTSTSTSGSSTTSAPSTSTTAGTTTTTKGTSPPNPSHWTEAALLAQLVMVGGEYSDPGASAEDLVDGAGGLVF